MRMPKVIQTVFHTPDGQDVAHDYYLNATWITDLCQRHGIFVASDYIRRAIESKRRKCVERYGEEWGETAIAEAIKRQRRRKPREDQGGTQTV